MSYSANLKDRIGRFVIYAIVLMLALVCLLPLWNIVAISFSSSEAVSANAVGLVPVNFTTAAYTKIIDDAQFWRSFGISVLRVALALVLNMILIILMAYPLSKSKRDFKGRNIYMNIMIFAMLFSGGMIPSYLLIKNLDMLNTIWALVLPGAVPIFSVILVMNFFSAVPKALEEAAFIDGANPLQVLFKVYVPVSIPALATVALFSIVGTWNDFFGGLIYMTKVSNYPLMTYIQSLNVNIADLLQAGTNSSELSNLTEISNKNLNAAKIVVAVIPLLMIYPLLQKYFVTGIVVGSVKE
ncbi:carbohydrate ABC transporter permease [Paenibacillus sp. FSL H7-0942]|uniref:carbohydrate ABC transporter permease n=1 Tax=Paenibacillus sp. FSL H7-0942 TaxID=2921444 RepID=UPI003246393E